MVDRNYNNLKGVSYTAGLLFLIGLVLVGFTASAFLARMVLEGTGAPLKEAMSDPRNAGVLRWLQVAGVVISMLLPALLAAIIISRKPFHLLGFRNNVSVTQVALVIGLMFCALMVSGSLAFVNREIAEIFGWGTWAKELEKSYNDQVALILDTKTVGGYVTSLFIIAFIPALAEETLFRGALQNFITRATKIPVLSIIIVSLFFSLIHFSIFGFLVRLFLGLVLGYLFYYTNNIWLCIIAHFFNNALAVSSIFFFTRQGTNIKEAMAKDVPVSYWGFLAVPVIVWLFAALIRHSKKDQLETGSSE